MSDRMDDERVNAALTKLESALPEGHPARQDAADLIRAMWTELGEADLTLNAAQIDHAKAEETMAAHARLLEVLEDWRRGIRDWSEVELALKDAGLANGKMVDRA